MKAYRMVTVLPSGNKIESALFRWRRGVEMLVADKTVKLMHDIVDRKPSIEAVEISIWKWLVI